MHWVSCLRQNVSATQVRYPSILILTLKNFSQTRCQRMWCSEVLQILLQAQHQLRQQLFDAEFPTLNETEIQSGEDSKSITLAPMAGTQSDLDKCKRREHAGMLWWDSCSGLRVLEDDQIPARSSEKWRLQQQTWMGEKSTRWSCSIVHA